MNPFKLALAAIILIASLASFAHADGSYGGLYVSAGAAAQAMSTSAAKLTGFVTALPNDSTDVSVTPVAASDHITLVAGGVYLIHFDITALVGTADITINYTLRDGSTAITGATCSMEAEAATTPTNTSMTFIYKPTAAATLSVYAASASSTPNLTPQHATLIVTRIQ